MAYDLAQSDLDAARALRRKIIAAGGVLEYRTGSRQVKRVTLADIGKVIDDLERDTHGSTAFHLSEWLDH